MVYKKIISVSLMVALATPCSVIMAPPGENQQKKEQEGSTFTVSPLTRKILEEVEISRRNELTPAVLQAVEDLKKNDNLKKLEALLTDGANPNPTLLADQQPPYATHRSTALYNAVALSSGIIQEFGLDNLQLYQNAVALLLKHAADPCIPAITADCDSVGALRAYYPLTLALTHEHPVSVTWMDQNMRNALALASHGADSVTVISELNATYDPRSETASSRFALSKRLARLRYIHQIVTRRCTPAITKIFPPSISPRNLVTIITEYLWPMPPAKHLDKEGMMFINSKEVYGEPREIIRSDCGLNDKIEQDLIALRHAWDLKAKDAELQAAYNNYRIKRGLCTISNKPAEPTLSSSSKKLT